jgi:cytochrome c peroxidase
MTKKHLQLAVTALALAAVATVEADSSRDRLLRAAYDHGVRYSQKIDFPNRISPNGDPVSGQAQFGLSADGHSIDLSRAVFDGTSVIAGSIQANGRGCATCHRPEAHLGLPPGPLSATIPMDDPLFTGIEADAQGDPLSFDVFNQFGLVHHRPHRFNPTLAPNDPYFRLFNWRKSTHVLNTVFTYGFLTEGRARDLVELTRGAIFTHTQNGPARFDDIANQHTHDIAVFMEQQIDPPVLKDLLDPAAPLHDTLINDPFYTVHPTNDLERRGKVVFINNCMSCHNMPNVFSNKDHVDGPPLNFPPPAGHTFDIGVAQRNALHLEFRDYDVATGQRVPLVLPLVTQDGRTINVTVKDDVGLAGTTARYEDLHRFKVPQLRDIKDLGPYFHDNSAATLEDVVEYFNSDDYNQSTDGSQHPIHLSGPDQQALLAFLRIL